MIKLSKRLLSKRLLSKRLLSVHNIEIILNTVRKALYTIKGKTLRYVLQDIYGPSIAINSRMTCQALGTQTSNNELLFKTSMR